jgi:hypothetical protein
MITKPARPRRAPRAAIGSNSSVMPACDPRVVATLLSAVLAACSYGSGPEPEATNAQAVIGQCTRNEAALRSSSPECAIDSDCPCGSYCDDVDHACRFQCMVPPGNQAEACATGTQCDDTGRCVAPGHTPPSNAPTLSANPAALTTIVGGAPGSLQVKLTMFTGGTALLAAAATPVRAVANDGAQVSCDGGASFGHDCTLTAWSFAFDGTQYNASKALLARTPAGATLGAGQVHLRIDDLDADTVVPVSAALANSTSPDGDYHGLVTSWAVPAGIPVTAHVRGRMMIVEDPTRTLGPDGAFSTQLYTPTNPTPGKTRVFWLEAPNAVHDPNSGLYADYQPAALNFNAATGALTTTFYRELLNNQEPITLNLTRDPGPPALCNTDADCSNGWACSVMARVCAPHSAIDGGPTAFWFLDPRSSQWFDAIDDLIGNGTTVTGAARPELATTGAELIESLACTTPQNGAGHLGLVQIKQSTGASRSGDLACVLDNNLNNLTLNPGAVGLATYYDRKGNAPAEALLNTCLADLARPITSSFTTAFASSNGDCVNLARFLPALRLLATGELNKQTSINTFPQDARLSTLARRLVGAWGQLHGFIATTGLQKREFEDATTATPTAARANLLALLDVMDAGWAALLDARVAPMIQNLVGTEDGSDDALFWPEVDYRLNKKPSAYWTFNNGQTTDLIQNAQLVVQRNPRCDIFLHCDPPPPSCLPVAGQSSWNQGWSCPGMAATLPATAHVSDPGNMSVTFNVDPLDAEFPPYSGGTILATATLAVFETWDSGGQWLNLAHPTASGTPQIVSVRTGLLGYWTGGTTGGAGPTFGTQVAVVRDTLAKTYTVYVYDPSRNGGQPQTFVVGYSQPVSGMLPSMSANRVIIGAGPLATVTNAWWAGTPQRRSSYAAHIDDVAIWNSMLSKREFERFARVRAFTETTRAVYPMDMVLEDYGTQELKTPVATDLLNAQIAHLELADRLAVHMRYQAQAACDSNDPAAKADVASVVARLGRTLRQSTAVKMLTGNGDADTTNADRVLLGAKTSQLIRDLTVLTTCRNPYNLTDREVPLYFNGISPTADEKAAFFAASDHLLTLAEQRTATAQTALDAVRTRWDQARTSNIAQLQDDTARASRVDELATKYGEALVRLCGISDRTPQQIIADIDAGTFSIDTCFIKPPQGTTCPTSNTSGPIMDADPTCYRGAIGGAVVDIRTAYYAQQAAYQSWQAAIGNSAAAEKLCVLKEMDVFGCSALDRHALTGVTCPAGHQGTIQLIENYNAEMIRMENEKSWFDAVVHTVSTIAAVAAAAATTGPGGAFLVAAVGVMKPVSDQMGTSMEDRKRAHEATLQERALVEDVRACWNTAEQYERSIAAAEQASQEASSRMQAAVIAFENNLAEGREIMAIAPQEIDRELSRPALPIAFHYWLPEALETYQLAYDSARRYTYMALRATEYDTLTSYATPQTGKPSRGAVLGAWLPPTLTQQLALMRDQTNTRTTLHGPPRLGHMTFDLGAKFFGLEESSDQFGAALQQYAQPVYSSHGEYLGLGVQFSLVPSATDEAPTWRCAERIWRVNLGAVNFPTTSDGTHVKLLKKNLFASRTCGGDGFQVATLRPSTNLLVGGGDASAPVPENTNSVADVALMDFNQPDALLNFKTRDDFLNGSSSELALQELYGDYVLLFPATALNQGLDLGALRDFFMRFDFLSVDNTPPVQAVMRKQPANASSSIVIPTGGTP